PHESPISMTLPLVVLAILSTVGGLVGIPYAISSVFGGGDINVFERTLEPVIYHRSTEVESASPTLIAPGSHEAVAEQHPGPTTEHSTTAESAEHSTEKISTERWLAVLSVLLAALGIFTGIVIFGREPLKKLPKILVDKWRVDELYNGYIVDPLTNLS